MYRTYRRTMIHIKCFPYSRISLNLSLPYSSPLVKTYHKYALNKIIGITQCQKRSFQYHVQNESRPDICGSGYNLFNKRTHQDNKFKRFPLHSCSTGSLFFSTKVLPKKIEDVPDKSISNWLFVCSGIVIGMILLGGLTRLTKSGLSMVTWKPQGSLPPMSQEDWEEEFSKYKQYPEYQKNSHQCGMTLAEFKFIYLMEYSHRMLGRVIGIAFGIPLLYFTATGRLRGRTMLQKRLIGLFCLGGFQGLVGWWMVKSGLDENIQEDLKGSVRVSPYRLSFHLVSAFFIYSLLMTTALKLHPRTSGIISQKMLNLQNNTGRTLAWTVTGLIGVTIFSGSLVAGNRAGLIYNEFPLMGGRWIPEDCIDETLQPKWRNIFENSTLVQFDHRVLGIMTFYSVVGVWFYARRFPSSVRFASNCLLGMTALQVTLGVSTLLFYVPTPLASAHQAGAVGLLSTSLYFLHTMRSAAVISSPATTATYFTILLVICQQHKYIDEDENDDDENDENDKKGNKDTGGQNKIEKCSR